MGACDRYSNVVVVVVVLRIITLLSHQLSIHNYNVIHSKLVFHIVEGREAGFTQGCSRDFCVRGGNFL